MFERLDVLENLRVRRHREGDRLGRRCLNGGRNDAVTDILAECQSAAQLAAIAHRFGLSAEEILTKASRAASFGQFRMAIGNRIRGIVRRIDRARKRGREMPLREAVRPSRGSAAPAGRRWRRDGRLDGPEGPPGGPEGPPREQERGIP